MRGQNDQMGRGREWAPWLRNRWGARRTLLLHLSCAAMGLLTLTKLGSEFYRLVWETGVKGAIDLKLLREFTLDWFSGIPVYERFAFANYPPATAPLLWPLLGWLDLPAARALWAFTSVLAMLWLVWLMVRASNANTRLGATFVALMCLSMNALGVTIGNGQLALHILPPLLAAILLLRQPRREWGKDLLVAGLLVWALVKPSLLLPFFWVVLFLPGGWRPAFLTAAAYLALTLFAASFQDAALPTLLQGCVARGVAAAGGGYGNIQTWLATLGLHEWTFPAMLAVLAGCGAWVYRHRHDDLWKLLGVAAIIARLWAYHRKYDDLLILLPMVTLFRIAKRGPLPHDHDVWAGLLLAITIAAMLLPARLRFAPAPWSWPFTVGHVLVWVVVLIFLLQPEYAPDTQERRT